MDATVSLCPDLSRRTRGSWRKAAVALAAVALIGVGGGGFLAGDGDECIHSAVERIDAFEMRFDQIDRRQLARLNELRGFSNGQATQAHT